MMMQHKNLVENLNFPWFSYGYQNCLFVNSLTKHKHSFQIVFNIDCDMGQ